MNQETQTVITRAQREILEHTHRRAAGGLYCGDGADIQTLVGLGLMAFAGRKSFVPDPYFQLTDKGRRALASWSAQPQAERIV